MTFWKMKRLACASRFLLRCCVAYLLFGFFWLGLGGRVVVVLLVVDLLAVVILLLVYLLVLLVGESAIVGRAFVVHLLVYARLVGVSAGGFAGGFLTGAETLCGALLLVGFAVVNFVGPHGVGVVVVVVDLAASCVLLAVDLSALLVGEGATVGLAIAVDLVVDVGLGVVGAGGFARGHLAGAKAVGDALILICFTVVGVVGFAGRAVGGRDGLRGHALLGHLVVGRGVGGGHGGRAAVVDGG